jgi:hypothetical protein
VAQKPISGTYDEPSCCPDFVVKQQIRDGPYLAVARLNAISFDSRCIPQHYFCP